MNRNLNPVLTLSLQSLLLAWMGFSATTSWAVPIAVIDSGIDFKHEALVNHTWQNPGGLAGDSFVGDQSGWNFAEHNAQVIDYSYMGKFSPDTSQYFEVQLRGLNGSATEEDKKWLEDRQKDEKFMQELATFGNFIHGTHVAGITARNADGAQVMAAKIIPTQIKEPQAALKQMLHELAQAGLSPFSFRLDETPTQPSSAASGSGIGGFFQNLLIEGALWYVANQQASLLQPVGQYVAATQMRVANCSFGTGSAQAKEIVRQLTEALLRRDVSSEEAEKYTSHFLSVLLTQGQSFPNAAKNTLFVIAAGNDHSDNDQNPDYPGSLRMDNTITVAATREFDRLASFSNYGATSVDIAAPGVGIRSSIPTPTENETLTVSGTSQAAPYISNIAGRVLDENPSLSPLEVKKILMQTADHKSFLEGKVVSAGIANEERALVAARLSTQNVLALAIEIAKRKVSDVESLEARDRSDIRLRTRATLSGLTSELSQDDSGDDGVPIDRPSLFYKK